MKRRTIRDKQDDQDLCGMCGNELPPALSVCPFCATPRASGPGRRTPPARIATINLKKGLPTVDEAMTRFDRELDAAVDGGARVVRIIHGWGSGGKGGAIRDEVRRYLNARRCRHRVNMLVNGEDLNDRTVAGRQMLSSAPDLKDDRGNLDNPGVTFVTFARQHPS